MNLDEIISYLFSSEFQNFLLPFKIVFIVIALIFLIAIIFFVAKQELLFAEKKTKFLDFFTFKGFKKEKGISEKWKEICRLLEKNLEPEYKLALVETDSLFFEIFQKMGYSGKNLAEQLNYIQKDAVVNLEEIKKLPELRNSIVYDPDYKLNLEVTKNILKSCQEALKNLGAL